MDRDILRAVAPADYETAAPLYAYLLLLDYARQIIDAIAKEDRDPDDWEASHLTDGLNALEGGLLMLAFKAFQKALAVPPYRVGWPACGRLRLTVLELRQARYRAAQ